MVRVPLQEAHWRYPSGEICRPTNVKVRERRPAHPDESPSKRSIMSEASVPALINGQWRPSRSTGTFQADDPSTGEPLPDRYPVSSREEVLAALQAGSEAAEALRT